MTYLLIHCAIKLLQLLNILFKRCNIVSGNNRQFNKCYNIRILGVGNPSRGGHMTSLQSREHRSYIPLKILKIQMPSKNKNLQTSAKSSVNSFPRWRNKHICAKRFYLQNNCRLPFSEFLTEKREVNVFVTVTNRVHHAVEG